MTSLYLLGKDFILQMPFLSLFDTEKESESIYELSVSEPFNHNVCQTLLPNCELFCFGDDKLTGATFIIDNDYNIRVLSPGVSCYRSSVIYFNRNVYCFGGYNKYGKSLNLSARFDLDKNRWFKLTPMPIYDHSCNSVIFNGNILISGYHSRNLLLYSIDIDSFSTISNEFEEYQLKILAKAEKLYLIECNRNGLIYESEDGNEYAWKQIGKSIIAYLGGMHCLYNKGAIYIASDFQIEYYKFDLSQKKLSSFKGKT